MLVPCFKLVYSLLTGIYTKFSDRLVKSISLNRDQTGKNIILCILKGISPFKMHRITFFPENLKKIWVSLVNLGRVGLP